MFATDDELQRIEVDSQLSQFNDDFEVSDWAWQGVSWAIKNGFTVGNGGYLYPQSEVTRARAAVILYRIITSNETMDDILYETPAYTVRITPDMQRNGITLCNKSSFEDMSDHNQNPYAEYMLSFAQAIENHYYHMFSIEVLPDRKFPKSSTMDSYYIGPCSAIPGTHVWITEVYRDMPLGLDNQFIVFGVSAKYYAQYVVVK